MPNYKFEHLVFENRVLSPAYISLDDQGLIKKIDNRPEEETDYQYMPGAFIPGIPNAHSHAFQYAFAGKTEYLAGPSADFWSWREKMYELALSVSPEQVSIIAETLYAQMLCQGYTSVAEFHYLHHDQNGKPYPNLAQISKCLEGAAKKVGINLTLIPIFYARGGFEKAALPEQKRFISKDIKSYFDLVAKIKTEVSCPVGKGVHSLRAATEEMIKEVFQGDGPTHLHLSEQTAEVEDCLKHWGKRPAEWALENLPLNKFSSLVHCTHLNAAETRGLAESGANVVLCPTTEANLADGFFSLREYKSFDGTWSIGSDSHIGLCPFEELRWLDYQSRLQTHKRVPLCNKAGEQASEYLFKQAFYSGHFALGEERESFFQIGKELNCIGINTDLPNLGVDQAPEFLSKIIYAGNPRMIGTVIAKGKVVVKEGKHIFSDELHERYLKENF